MKNRNHSVLQSPLLLIFVLLFLLTNNRLLGQNFEKIYNIGPNFSRAFFIQEIDNQEYLMVGLTGFQAENVFLTKLDSEGEEVWTENFEANAPYSFGEEYRRPTVIVDDNNDIYLAYSKVIDGAEDEEIILTKLDENGQFIWEQSYGTTNVDRVRQVLFAENGDLMLMGTSMSSAGTEQVRIVRVASDGTEIWTNFYGSFEPQLAGAMIKTSDNNFVISGRIGPNRELFLMKIDNDGAQLWMELYGYDDLERPMQMIEDNDGNLITVANDDTPWLSNQPVRILKTDGNGQEIWFETITGSTDNRVGTVRVEANNQITVTVSESPDGIIFYYYYTADGDFLGKVSANDDLGDLVHTVHTLDGGHITVGWVNYQGNGLRAYAIKVGSPDYTLTGKIFDDENEDCLQDADEEGVLLWYVKAENTDGAWFGVADANGDYEIALPEGTYDVTVFSPIAFWELCQDFYTITVDNTNPNETLNIPVQGIIDCPYLEVQIGNPAGLRVCEEDDYSVSYCNYGATTAEAAYVEITLDAFQTYVSSTLPFQNQTGQTFRFQIGDVEPGDCGAFEITTELACDTDILGYTHCVEAHIFPDSVCIDTALWSGASLEVIGECVDGTIQFSAKNIGTATTTPTLNFIVIEDEVIYMQGGIDDLNPNAEELLVSIPANGNTFRIQVEQEAGHPGFSMPTYFVEGCTVDNSQPISTGFVNIFPPDDEDHFIDIACQENNYPYDPNEKLAVPYGYGDEHFIHANQQIEYTIRFQNTGTAEANKVVIRDSLPATLDPTTLRPGASSHPYEFTMEGNGVAIFTFNDIELPDSTTNFEESIGFVKFDIRQQPDLPNGTLIENNAAIFFDLASPVITPTAFHTVGEDFIIFSDVSTEFKSLTINAFPNPFNELTTIKLDEMDLKNVELQLFDAIGRLVKTVEFSDNKVALQREELTSGIYFFTIQSEERFVGNGKLVVQ